MPSDVLTAYSSRAAEYSQLLGSMSVVHPADVHLVTSWAAQFDGPILDAGCGPGHWTGHLSEQGRDVRGIDQTPEFIDHARRTYPETDFAIGSIDALPESPAGYAGVLAWYSLIHHEPKSIATALDEFARVLRPGGGLLLGFFVGPTLESFGHSIITAYRWPPEALAEELSLAGFDILETHTRTVSQAKPRPHGAILATKRS